MGNPIYVEHIYSKLFGIRLSLKNVSAVLNDLSK